MAAEGQEIKDERVENPTTTQEEGGDDEVGSTSLFTFFMPFGIILVLYILMDLLQAGRNRRDESTSSRDGIRSRKTARDASHPGSTNGEPGRKQGGDRFSECFCRKCGLRCFARGDPSAFPELWFDKPRYDLVG